MDEIFRQTMDDFASVWQRVGGMPSPAAPDADGTEFLRRFLREAYCDALYYTSLSRMFPASGRNTLLGHAQEAKTCCRTLRAEYFIRTGETIAPKENCPLVGGKLASLRSVMLRESEQAKALRQAAQAVSDEALCTLFLRLAEDADRRAQTDRALLLDCF